MRIAINGLGRIGRSVLRALIARGFDGFDVVALNDPADPENLAYLLEYDSTFGPLGVPVRYADGQLKIGSHVIPLTQEAGTGLDPRAADITLDCSGQFKTFEAAEAWRHANVGPVLISGPLEGSGPVIVLGSNEDALGQADLVSMGSCTTNATAVLLSMFERVVGIETGHFTTIHCYTNSQPTIDRPGAKWERGRAAALSMVPTSTSATEALGQVLPGLAERMTGASIRVPTASVSAIDLVFQPKTAVTEADVVRLVKAAAETGPAIGWTDQPLVSSDVRARPETSIVALPEIRVNAAGWVRVLAWYDNEWGFACRMLDVSRMMVARSAN
ncbi:type I glyceraldehyde-3-phosphate dehydrogenase [Shimia ponticola]|uniref:type I glyceraldehyde-3-phosphate dehydrogenase n=1 Tax=Shimia ponticola TaxID=2582893 RepID=UPI0011BF2664|nr:glyceraldehyde 3-phosphate dehydrogenase NAD-binding domain-containing protein [Shimia ponticola]